MKDNCNTISQFKLNCWKHHAAFIKKNIKQVKKEGELKKLTSILLIIGESQMDLYLGRLTPFELTKFIKRSLKEKNAFKYEAYRQWLNLEGNDYRLIAMPDNSIWALRMGNERENYIHIHPGRYSLHTIRVRSLTLKTAIWIMAFTNIHKNIAINLQLINSVRKIYLNAEPIKSFSSATGLGKLLTAFEKL